MPKPKCIGLISAVPFESESVKAAMRDRSSPTGTVCEAATGSLGRHDAVLVSSGIGIANAALATAFLIERFGPGAIIVFGICGAYPSSGLGIGDLAIADREVYADSGILTSEGLRDFEACGFPLVQKDGLSYYSGFPVAATLDGLAAERVSNGPHTGMFLTVAQATGTRERATALERAYPGALCENMEGAAVVQACLRYRVPCMEIRGVSNIVEDRDIGKWNRERAAVNVQNAVLRLFD